MLDNYKARKEEVLRIYEEYLPYKDKHDKDEDKDKDKVKVKRETLENRAKNIRDDKFYLMVAGEAKSGKSTFINAFLGAEILPMDIKQCTSALIKIEYGEEKTLKTFYADGHSEQKNGDEEMQKFLKEHAALKDEYRKIPVTAINNEILIKSKGNVKDYAVNDLINGVKDDNTFNLEPKEYERLIRDYIDENKDSWQDIVTEITITYPFSEDMKDVTIIDSPGINASGMVGKVTEENIEKADAIILVKSLVGQALESKAFKSFLNSSARERCKGALLLILTGKAGVRPEDVRTLQELAVNMYSNSIPEKQIAVVDSKFQLFRNICEKMDEDEINRFLKKEGFDSATLRWYNTDRIRSDFLDFLEKDANFNQVHAMLEDFGRKAQTRQLYEFLSLISRGYGVICGKLNEHIKMFERSDNPAKLRLEIEKKQDEIEEIKLKMNKGIESIRRKYIEGDAARIKQLANDEFENYKRLISAAKSVDELKKKAINGQEKFNAVRKNLQSQIIEECNKNLVSLAQVTSIPAESLIPVFTEEDIKKIENETKKNANKSVPAYKDFLCFSYEDGTMSVYSAEKHLKAFIATLIRNIEKTKTEMINSVQSDLKTITAEYKRELEKNAEQKRGEYDKLSERLTSALEIQEEKDALKTDLSVITDITKNINAIIGEFEYVIN
jgi:hypothetical protein